MSGSVFSAAATLLVGILLLLGMGAGLIWVLPVALLALIPLLGASLMGKLRDASLGHEEPAGVPPTQDAAYTPQFDPSDRPT